MVAILPEALRASVEHERLERIQYEQIRLIAKSAARVGSGGYYDLSYDDIINPKPEDTRSAQEIVDDIVTRAGLEVLE